VDANGVACKLWWANANGAPERTRALVLRLAENARASTITLCWDAPAPTWRQEIFAAYKHGRRKKPDALVRAIAQCRALPFEHLEVARYEADDLLATLTRLALEHGDSAAVVSDDKDMLQLVEDPGCRVVTSAGKEIDEAGVMDRWGVPPMFLRALLGLMGDASDGLPGLPGVGWRRGVARALLGETGDPLTFRLVALADVPGLALPVGPAETPPPPEAWDSDSAEIAQPEPAWEAPEL